MVLVRRRTGLILVGVMVGLCAVGFVFPLRTSPQKAYERFCYSADLAEDQLMDPLILAGDKVAPLVIDGIKNPDMPRRRYAIQFLGNASSKESLPVLRSILANEQEPETVRADALLAIVAIQGEEGAGVAKEYAGASGFLAETSRGILSGHQTLPEKRTYWDAFWGRHD